MNKENILFYPFISPFPFPPSLFSPQWFFQKGLMLILMKIFYWFGLDTELCNANTNLWAVHFPLDVRPKVQKKKKRCKSVRPGLPLHQEHIYRHVLSLCHIWTLAWCYPIAATWFLSQTLWTWAAPPAQSMDRENLWVSVPVTVDVSQGSWAQLGWCNGVLSLLEWVAVDPLGLGDLLAQHQLSISGSVTSRSCCAEVSISGAAVCEVRFSYMIICPGDGISMHRKRLKISVRRFQLEKARILCIMFSHCMVAAEWDCTRITAVTF